MFYRNYVTFGIKNVVCSSTAQKVKKVSHGMASWQN